MEDPGEDGTDQASIKPVSSLRSLFEGKESNDTNSSLPSSLSNTRPNAIFNGARGGSPLPMRASLDIPRTAAWSTSEAVVDLQRKSTQGPPIPRPRRPNSRILQRPLSTTSLSTPQSPPLVTVQSPASSPKPLPLKPTQRSPDTSKPIPFPPAHSSPRSPRTTPVPPKPLARNATDLQTAPNDSENYGLKADPINKPTNDVPARKFTRTLPPPVNRSEKPKLPTKPSPHPIKVNLEAVAARVEERISPFSTPPSSDEGLGPDIRRPHGLGGNAGRQIGAREHLDDQSRQSIEPHSPYALQRTGEGGKPSKQQKFDAGTYGLTQATDSHNDQEGLPPGLPPRSLPIREVVSAGNPEETRRKIAVAAHLAVPAKTKELQTTPGSIPKFLPPPKRASIHTPMVMPHRENSTVASTMNHSTGSRLLSEDSHFDMHAPKPTVYASADVDYPDASNSNRCPPIIKDGAEEIEVNHDTRLVDICGRYVATTGHSTRVWDVTSGAIILNIGHSEREVRVTSLAFKPATRTNEEGSNLWLGTNCGEIQEVNIPTQAIVCAKAGAHERREVVKIYRHQNSMWTLDDGGRLCVWPGNVTGLPDLHHNPVSYRVPRGHSFSLVVEGNLWLATNREIGIYRPCPAGGESFSVLQEPLSQPGVGAVTSGAIISCQLDRIYFGHADGKVTVYSTKDYECLNIIGISAYKISCLAGAGFHLWAGYSTGFISVYDTRTQPWTITKDWLAHENPVLSILVDRSSLWRTGILRVVSLAADNTLRFWDGTLQDDWLENDMYHRDIEYCSFRELTALVISWNVGAATPTHLRYNETDCEFFPDVLRANAPADLLVFGFQELVDLEDKKLTARTLLKGSKKKDPSEQEHMSRQYRAWRDYLVRCIEDTMPSNEPYHLLYTASMVGLFNCVFIKASLRSSVRSLNTAEIKRGMGGLHGNKGALLSRFFIDDSSICLVNCHLAAGQTQTVNRNNDITAILDSSILPRERNPSHVNHALVGGGDGSMILDHEVCILHGDLNYRIDTMGRDTVVRAVDTNNLSKLLERDQLLVSRRRNPGFRVRAFKECPITFAPTYKYDVGSDRYDTSEKRRAPAWCDRILYRGAGKIKQLDYRRHDLRVSDHRPISGRFKIRIKAVNPERRAIAWKQSQGRFEEARKTLATEAKVEYLRDVLGVPPHEAKRLL